MLDVGPTASRKIWVDIFVSQHCNGSFTASTQYRCVIKKNGTVP
jgi:hypothetical protein